MKSAQLFRLSSAGFRLPVAVESGSKIYFVDAEGLPLIRWPDGRWCFPANSFMLKLLREGLSRAPRGGTLGTYAAHLSHLVRFCHASNINFHELTDQQFTLFMRSIQDERCTEQRLDRVRTSTTTVAIGHVCLKFLEHVGELVGQPNFVGPDGAIQARKRRTTYRGITRVAWHHYAFPVRSADRKRVPISTNQIERLHHAATEHSKTLYQRMRRYIMLRLLEITGGRRSEVAALTVESVRNAAYMDKPALALVTRKRGDSLQRLVPITRHDARALLDFADRCRSKVVKSTCGTGKDDGVLLVSETTGHGLRGNTITQEVSALALKCALEERACPHMFRHRFITKLFVALIEQHAIENQDSFRRTLLSTDTFKQQVMEWTGHKKLNSLDRYIHLAFSELSGLATSIDTVQLWQHAEAAEQRLAQLESALLNGQEATDVLQQIRQLISDLRAELRSSKK